LTYDNHSTIVWDLARESCPLLALPQFRSDALACLGRPRNESAGLRGLLPHIEPHRGEYLDAGPLPLRRKPMSASLLMECRKLVREVTAQSIMLRRDVSDEIAIAVAKLILEREAQNRES
jgi:hypothetical protein